MINKRSLFYSGALLLSLVFVAVLLNRGLIQAVQNDGDVTLTIAPGPTAFGDPVVLEGTLRFPNFEQATLSGVQLIITRKDATDTPMVNAFLPLGFTTEASTTFIGVSEGILKITHWFVDIEPFATNTLGDSTLPGGGKFKGISEFAELRYTIMWTSISSSGGTSVVNQAIANNASFLANYESKLRVHILGRPDIDNINESNVETFTIVPAFSITDASVAEDGGSVDLNCLAEPCTSVFGHGGLRNDGRYRHHAGGLPGLGALPNILPRGSHEDRLPRHQRRHRL